MLSRQDLDFDPYSLLQVPPAASDDEIRSAYQRLARTYHPDLNPGIESSRMERLNQAYAVLGDSQRRASYDAQHSTLERSESRRMGASSAIPGTTEPPGSIIADEPLAVRDRECRRCHRIVSATAARCSLCGAA
jgi:curved DNA-binding protein CbpA